MKPWQRISLLVLLGAGLLITGLFLLKQYCPAQGIAFSQQTRNFHRLKNRTEFPRTTDFDNSVTLSSMLQSGTDSTRWSSSRAARVQGYVVSIGKAGVELANCYIPCNRDIHLNLALRPDAPSREQLVVEITPRLAALAKRQGLDWSEGALKAELLGHWCYFEGWLFFDWTHAGESENTAPQGLKNWRATAWELHPVTYIQVNR